MGAWIHHWAVIYNSGCSFTACWKMGMAMVPIVVLGCANIFTSSLKILLQSWSWLIHSRQFIMCSRCLVLLSAQLLQLLGVAGRMGCCVHICLRSGGFSGAVLASVSVEVGTIILPTIFVRVGGIILAYFMGTSWRGLYIPLLAGI